MSEANADAALAAATTADVVSPRFGYFQRQSMQTPDPDRKSFNMENPPGASGRGAGVAGGGHQPSESVAKMESLEPAERAVLASTILLKTGFYILISYTFNTRLTL